MIEDFTTYSLQSNRTLRSLGRSIHRCRRGYCLRPIVRHSSQWLWCCLHCFHQSWNHRSSKCCRGRCRSLDQWDHSSGTHRDNRCMWGRSMIRRWRQLASRGRRHLSSPRYWSTQAQTQLSSHPNYFHRSCKSPIRRKRHQVGSRRLMSLGRGCNPSQSIPRTFRCIVL